MRLFMFSEETMRGVETPGQARLKEVGGQRTAWVRVALGGVVTCMLAAGSVQRPAAAQEWNDRLSDSPRSIVDGCAVGPDAVSGNRGTLGQLSGDGSYMVYESKTAGADHGISDVFVELRDGLAFPLSDQGRQVSLTDTFKRAEYSTMTDALYPAIDGEYFIAYREVHEGSPTTQTLYIAAFDPPNVSGHRALAEDILDDLDATSVTFFSSLNNPVDSSNQLWWAFTAVDDDLVPGVCPPRCPGTNPELFITQLEPIATPSVQQFNPIGSVELVSVGNYGFGILAPGSALFPVLSNDAQRVGFVARLVSPDWQFYVRVRGSSPQTHVFYLPEDVPNGVGLINKSASLSGGKGSYLDLGPDVAWAAMAWIPGTGQSAVLYYGKLDESAPIPPAPSHASQQTVLPVKALKWDDLGGEFQIQGGDTAISGNGQYLAFTYNDARLTSLGASGLAVMDLHDLDENDPIQFATDNIVVTGLVFDTSYIQISDDGCFITLTSRDEVYLDANKPVGFHDHPHDRVWNGEKYLCVLEDTVVVYKNPLKDGC